MVAPGAGVRGRGSSIGAPGAGLRIACAKNLRGQGSRLSTGQAEGGPYAPGAEGRSSRGTHGHSLHPPGGGEKVGEKVGFIENTAMRHRWGG